MVYKYPMNLLRFISGVMNGQLKISPTIKSLELSYDVFFSTAREKHHDFDGDSVKRCVSLKDLLTCHTAKHV